MRRCFSGWPPLPLTLLLLAPEGPEMADDDAALLNAGLGGMEDRDAPPPEPLLAEVGTANRDLPGLILRPLPAPVAYCESTMVALHQILLAEDTQRGKQRQQQQSETIGRQRTSSLSSGPRPSPTSSAAWPRRCPSRPPS